MKTKREIAFLCGRISELCQIIAHANSAKEGPLAELALLLKDKDIQTFLTGATDKED